MSADPYAILEVRNDASDLEIKAAYRQLAALYHPDRNPGFQAAATERLKGLNEAYALIVATRRQGPTTDATTGERGRSNTGPERENRARGEPQRDAAAAERDAQEDPAARDRAYRASIATRLERLGFLTTSASSQEDVVVEVLASLMPHGADIVGCVFYREFEASGPYPFQEVSGQFLRVLPPTAPASPFGSLRSFASPSTLPRTQVALCTKTLLLWTTSRLANADGIVVEESITAHSVRFAEILGATLGRKGTVNILVDEGPTLTFRTSPGEAAELASCVETGSASQ